MRRRRYLAALGAGASGLLAGCSESGGGQTTAATATPGGTTPSVAEAFEVTKRGVTETTRLNEVWVFGFTVRNRTDTARVFRSTISSRIDGGEWRQFDRPLTLDVGPGEAKTWRSPRIKFQFLRSYTYRLDATGTTWSVEVIPLTLDYGLTYTSPVGLQITVGTILFRDEKPRTAGDPTATPTSTPASTATSTPTPTPPPPTAADTGGTKWAVVPVEVQNPTDQPRSAPFPQEFTFRANGETYADVPLDRPDLFYRDRALKTGEPLSGNLYYEVPAGLDARDVEFVLQRSYDQRDLEGEIEVIWSR